MKAKHLKPGDRFITPWDNDCTMEVLVVEPFEGDPTKYHFANWTFRVKVVETRTKHLKVGESVTAALMPDDEVELVT